ncbi:hypothetical protein [Streptomyces sp. NPDC014746]|uniref:amino acid kinase family protein n=1 Tax=Streptomyces sp. NPDC014746 TaxID=3364904 RepID=UPI0036F6E982
MSSLGGSSGSAGRVPAEILVGTLPRLRELEGRTLVVVAGHDILADAELRHAFCDDIAFLRYSGTRPVVVHDGGPHPPLGVDEDPTALRRYVAGYVQRQLVGLLNDRTPSAVGITGEDGGSLTVRSEGGVLVDTGVIETLLDSGHLLVMSSIAYGGDGDIHHLDAASAAAPLASALRGALVLPTGAGRRQGAAHVDMSQPHAVLRHFHRL